MGQGSLSGGSLCLANDRFFGKKPPSHWVEVDASPVHVENCCQFDGLWPAMIRRLKLDESLRRVLMRGRKGVSWRLNALVLVITRLCRPPGKPYLAEQRYGRAPLPELSDADASEVNDNTLYKSLDRVLLQVEAMRKDRATLKRREERIEERLKSVTGWCERRRRAPQKVEREVGA